MTKRTARNAMRKHFSRNDNTFRRYFYLRLFSWGGRVGAVLVRRPSPKRPIPERFLVANAPSWAHAVRQACSGFMRAQA